MGRIYTATDADNGITTTGDIVEITAPSDGTIEILSFYFGQTSDAGNSEAEMSQVSIKRVGTSGSGGATVTPLKHDAGDGATGATIESYNTTDATPEASVSGWGEAFNLQAGLFYTPTPEERILIGPSEGIVFKLEKSPADAIDVVFRLTWEERGG